MHLRRLTACALLLLPLMWLPDRATAAGGDGDGGGDDGGDDGGSSTDLRLSAGGPYTVEAGGTVELSAADSDVDHCSSVTYSWDLDGDGLVDTSESEEPTVDFDASDWDGPVEVDVHVYVVCWLIDDLASVDGTAGGLVSVRNAPPVISGIERPDRPVEGETHSLSVDFTDPEAADTHSISWGLGDGTVQTGQSITHSWAQDGEVEVEVTVLDDDGSQDTWLSRINVVNDTPEIVGDPDRSLAIDVAWSFSPEVVDAGIDDVHSWSADLPLGVDFDAATGAMSWTPGADDLGPHACVLSVEDDAGDGDTILFTLTVNEENTGGTDSGTAGDGGSTAGDGGSRDQGDGSADSDPWAGQYEIVGEGCRCGGGSPAAALWLLPGLAALLRRRRT